MWNNSDKPSRSNKHGSLARLKTLLRRLEKDPELMESYDKIIQDQITDEIVEKVTEKAIGREFYLPHKPVVRHTAESTKVRIVFDASSKEDDESAP